VRVCVSVRECVYVCVCVGVYAVLYVYVCVFHPSEVSRRSGSKVCVCVCVCVRESVCVHIRGYIYV